MNIKKLIKKGKSPYGNHNPRVRKSYYTFSKEYPAGNIPLERRSYQRLQSQSRKKKLLIFTCFLLLGISFFSVRLLLDISHKVPTEEEITTTVPSTTAPSADTEVTDPSQPTELTGPAEQVQTQESTSLLEAKGLRALYMPYEHLGDTEYIKDFIKELEKKDCNGVVIDFKTKNGKLCYSSLNSYAISARCAIYDNNTVREALSIFKKEGITVAARVFCFLDNTIPVECPELAVKYMDTDVNWIDTTAEGDSKTWLNPCSREALLYLVDIIDEIQSFNIGGFILEACHFPDSNNTGGASFPGENAFKNKNAVLQVFINKIRKTVSEDKFVIFSMDADDALNGNEKIYYGEVKGIEFDGVAAYTKNRPEDTVLDKRTDYASMLALFEGIEKNFEGKSFIPVIDMSEYSRKYMRTVKKNCLNFIIIDETGEY